MRKKKWVFPFLTQENDYLVKDLNELKDLSKIYVEIGMGMGDFIIDSAKLNPDIFYVGLEKVDTCVARAIQKAQENKLSNFKVILENADKITELFDENSIDLIYLHFSDPWPKKEITKEDLLTLVFK
jgi:Predicted S-adenosylmethionine-dependent methyltransferase